jgi:hypothetical protein
VTRGEPFEYALIRVVPRVERGEAINAGVILYSQRHGFLGCQLELDTGRLLALDPGADVVAVTAALTAIDADCQRPRPAGQSAGDRFRWLTATRSTMVQPSPVHTGLTADPAAELAHLFNKLVR